MSLLDLFKPVKAYTADEVHAEITAKTILLMESMKQQIEAISLPAEMKNELGLLQDLGFTNSQNLIAIHGAKQRVDDVNAKRRMISERIRIVQLFHDYYGPNAMLMRLDDLIALLEKYNLSCGFLGNYTGSIPNKNLEEIARAKSFLDKLDPLDEMTKTWSAESILSDSSLQRYGRVRMGVNIDYNDGFFLQENIIRYHRLIEYTSSYAKRHQHMHLMPFEQVPNEFYPSLQTSEYTVSSQSSRLLIAAPVQEMNNASKLRKRIRTEDPFVFSVAKQGVIIYSCWGDEGNDEVMQKYRKVNEWIASCEAFKTLED